MTTLNRRAAGKRPVFVTGDPDGNTNRLLAIVSALAAEVAVLRDRQQTLEKLLEEHADIPQSLIEEFEPTGDDEQARTDWQQGFLRRVYAVLEQEALGAGEDGTAPP